MIIAKQMQSAKMNPSFLLSNFVK